ncbi:MAG: alginate export family protein, partial [Planctomycetota bacterium]
MATYQGKRGRRAHRRSGARTGVLGAALAALLGLGLAAAPARAADPPADDPLTFRTEDGEHVLKLSLESRFRQEWWDAHASKTEHFTAFRSRVSAKYAWKEFVEAFVQFQDARINGMESTLSGAGDLYYRFAGNNSKTHGDRIRQLWVQIQPIEDLKFRLGRQDIKLGTEVMYPEPNWKYLKVARGSQRLVGTVGWTHAERSNDGVAASYDLGDYLVYAFGAKPTTGVFDIRRSYSSQSRITYGGATFTAKRGTWLPNSEVRLFGLGYEDKRHIRDGGLSDNRHVNVYTVGFSLIRVEPVDGGNFDVLLWGAYQWGGFPD